MWICTLGEADNSYLDQVHIKGALSTVWECISRCMDCTKLQFFINDLKFLSYLKTHEIKKRYKFICVATNTDLNTNIIWLVTDLEKKKNLEENNHLKISKTWHLDKEMQPLQE